MKILKFNLSLRHSGAKGANMIICIFAILLSVAAYAADGAISNSYAIGNVHGVYNVGGISGSGGSVTSSYFVGKVTATDGNSGGISGSNTSAGNSYYNSDSIITGSSIGNPRATTAMKIPSTYVNWDFQNTWVIFAWQKFAWQNEGYPILNKQISITMATPQQPYTYNGDSIKPGITVIHGNTTLTENTHYTKSYSDNVNAGTAKVTITGIEDYSGYSGFATFTINKLNFSISIVKWAYGDKPNTPVYSTVPEIPDISYSGTINGGGTYNNKTPPTEAGTYTVTATFPINDNYSGQRTANFTIDKAQDYCSVEMDDFISSGEPSVPQPKPVNAGTVTYSYKGTNNSYSGANIPFNPGEYRVTATFAGNQNYNQCTATNDFTIYEGDATFVDVVWDPPCNSKYTYNGIAKSPKPSAEGYAPTLSSTPQTNAGTYTATAKVTGNVVLRNQNCQYTIDKKPITVTWTGDSVFTYNKMNQSPKPSVNKNELHDQLDFVLLNDNTSAGEYKGDNAALYDINSQDPNFGNYILLNNRANYTILKKDLKPKFETGLPDFAYKNDTLRVPSEVFQDTAALQQILDSIVAYEGFATDTVKKETDDAKVLKGKAKVKIDYDVDRGVSHTPRYALAKRVETTQKATATIITDEVSADNYKPLDRSITIVGMEDDEGGYAMFCKREDGRCIALSAEICEFIYGNVVQTCGEVPIAHTPNPIPYTPAASHYYSLKGTFLGTQKPTTPGIYIAKIGKQTLKIAVR
ncbi:MAG: MBG domain-containing protein [Fibromonadales bacterium]|nr:MBG domain-containing protein [Fibromonadales bacterium]